MDNNGRSVLPEDAAVRPLFQSVGDILNRDGESLEGPREAIDDAIPIRESRPRPRSLIFSRRGFGLGLLAVGLTAAAVLVFNPTHTPSTKTLSSLAAAAQLSNGQTLSLPGVSGQLGTASSPQPQTLTVNGLLAVNNSIVIKPMPKPSNAVRGQLYYDANRNQLAYYNGSQFVYLASTQVSVNSTPNGAALSVGPGLTKQGNQINNAGVLSLQGQTGSVVLGSGAGISIAGTTVSNSGVLSVGGLSGSVGVGTGLSTSGGQLHNTGLLQIVAGTPNITVTDEGDGTYAIGASGSGSGTVSSPGGITGDIPVFTGSQLIASSLLSQGGSIVTVAGTLTATDLQGDGSGVRNVDAISLDGDPASYFTDASNLSSGTIADALLSSNVPLLNISNNFTGTNLEHNGNDVCDSSDNCGYLTGSSANGSYLQLQSGTPGSAQTGNFNVSGTGIAGSLQAATIYQNGNQVCDTSGNCVGTGASGSAIGGSGTTNTLAMFTGTGTIGNSILTQNSAGDTLNVAGTLSATSLQGDGSAVSNVDAALLGGNATSYYTNAGNLNSGTLADARLSSNVALYNAVAANFTGALEQGGNAVCTTAGNCAGAGNGGGVTNAATEDYLTKTDASGNLVASLLYDNGTDLGLGTTSPNYNLEVNGTLDATTVYQNGNQVCDTSGNCTAVGAAGGDLTGNYPNPTIAKLQGTTVTTSGLSDGNFLQYDGTAWVNQSISGDITVNGSGLATLGAGAVTNADLANSSLTITAGAGLNGGGSVALGGSSSLNVVYGNAANTAVAGNTTLACPSGTGNLTGGGTVITLGSGGTCASLNTVNSPTFSGSLTVQGAGGITAGVADTANGVLALANASNSNLVTVESGATAASYTLTLPIAQGGSGQCLDNSDGAGTLSWTSCGGSGSTTTLQQAYNYSAGATPDIDLTSTDSGFTVQNDNTNPITGELFGVHANASSGLGSSLFSVANTGDTSVTSSDTTGTALTDTANSITTGNALSVSANGLTTGDGVSVASTSAVQTAGSLLSVSDTATLTTSGGSDTASLLNVSRALTADVPGGGGTATPTLDTSATFHDDSIVDTPYTTGDFTVGTHNNRYLIVGILNVSQNGFAPSSVKWGGSSGQSMSQIGVTQEVNNEDYIYYMTFWVLLAPNEGSSTFYITPGSGDYEAYDVVADSWYNVNQSTPYEYYTPSLDTNGSGNASDNASSASGHVVVDVAGTVFDTTPSLTEGSGQTLLSSYADSSLGLGIGSSCYTSGSSCGAATGSTTDMSWTLSTNVGWADDAVDLEGVTTTTSESVTAPVASISNSCNTSDNGSVCADATNVLSLDQEYSDASGAVLGVQNSGSGFGLQIQNGSSANALTVNTSNLTGIDSTTSSKGAVLTLGTNSSGDSIAAEGAVVESLGDYAEYFPQTAPGQLQPGEVACLDAAGDVEPCNTATNPSTTVAGVVSTAPGFVGNDQIYDPANPDHTALISMLGQVPVKVSTANGAIQVGDMLTMSSTPGVAVKATGPGMTIGTALGSYSGTGTGEVQLYVHVGYYDPSSLQSGDVSSGYVLQGDQATLSALTVNGPATIDDLTVSGSTTLASLTVTGTATVDNLTVQNATVGHLIGGGPTPTITADVGTCTGVTATIRGTDSAGLVTVTTPTTCDNVTGELARIGFSSSFAAAPDVSLTPGNSAAASSEAYVNSGTTSTTTFDISVSTGPLQPGTTYTWYYQVIQ